MLFRSVQASTLGGDQLGLFATKNINKKDNGGILCFFFGKLTIASDQEIRDAPTEIFGGLQRNVLGFPSKYNPIIYDAKCPTDKQQHLLLVTSECCFGSYVNSLPPRKCNCKIIDVPPMDWNPAMGFTGFDHWEEHIRKPILALRLTWYPPPCYSRANT